MNILFLILCLVSQSVDTLWTVEFASQPSGWIAGPYWEYTDESIFLFLRCVDKARSSTEDILSSPDFVVPPSADSLVLIFDHYWWGYGVSVHLWDWARSTSTLYMYSSSPPYTIELWEIADSCGGEFLESYSLIDSGSVCIPIPDILAGDTLSFTFRGLVESYLYPSGIGAEANIEWDIYTFSILSYPSVTLEQSTWGMIKASF